MIRSFRTTGASAAVSATLLILASAVPTLGHVGVVETEVPSGSTSIINLRVPHGCAGAPTDTIEVQLPEGVVGALPAYVPGWQVEVELVESEPYEQFGETLTERPGVIRWSGGDLPDFAFYDFAVRAIFAAEAGTVLEFPVVQRCGDVELAWIEPVVEGQPEPQYPLSTITVTEPEAEGGDH